MDCRTTHSWMTEYADGALDAARRARAEAHLAGCADCAALARQMAQTRSLLRGLTPAQTSPQFDARLAARLAAARRPSEAGAWWSRLFPAQPPLLRPALALGAAAFAVLGVLASHPFAPPPAPPTAPDDAALITQCVALHQRDVAAQPLTDSAATGVGHDGWTGGAAQGSL